MFLFITQNIFLPYYTRQLKPVLNLTFLTMKILVIFLLFIFSTFSLFATKPSLEKTEKKTALPLEYSDIMEDQFNENIETSESKIKIVIMDDHFNKIREESIDTMDDLYSKSILIPLIYRSELVAEINSEKFYILQ